MLYQWEQPLGEFKAFAATLGLLVSLLEANEWFSVIDLECFRDLDSNYMWFASYGHFWRLGGANEVLLELLGDWPLPHDLLLAPRITTITSKDRRSLPL